MEQSLAVVIPRLIEIFNTFERGGERLVRAVKTHGIDMVGKVRKTMVFGLLGVLAARKHRLHNPRPAS